MKIETIKTAELIPYARNAKLHSKEQVASIAASIQEFGFNNPVLVDADNGIIAGHGRILAAKQIGISEIPCVRLSHLTENQKRAYIIADNRLAETGGGWNEQLLLSELQAIDFGEFSSFGIEDFAGLAEEANAGIEKLKPEKTEPKDATQSEIHAEKLREKWGTASGQLWKLGRHRLLCGDSTKKENVCRALDGSTPFIMVTDPPYGVDYSANWRNEAIRANGKSLGCRATCKVANDSQSDWSNVWELFLEAGGSVSYVWHASLKTSVLLDSLFSAGFEMRSLIIWAKDNFCISRGNYHNQHESCWYAVRKGASAHFTDDRTQSTLFKDIPSITRPGEIIFVAKDEARKVYAISGDRSTLWQIPKNLANKTGHSTEKPLECMARPIRNHKDMGAVFEPFSGSGTTIMACENEGRECRAIELMPEYVAMALERWSKATDQRPELMT